MCNVSVCGRLVYGQETKYSYKSCAKYRLSEGMPKMG